MKLMQGDADLDRPLYYLKEVSGNGVEAKVTMLPLRIEDSRTRKKGRQEEFVRIIQQR